ncbi:MAG: hypothetical protein AYP45_05610 [Candidatus Brocadia carolinensis]|uniref:Uncharacterized protein n=1 Tax=Candidatus Brocadia carolinensis TaxID=1004156 RepID=A0A1V4AVF4_9BACT|nr:MAG: hypothetical protein AYP45_05610 [Candidatus Brocadia caroliniensis]
MDKYKFTEYFENEAIMRKRPYLKKEIWVTIQRKYFRIYLTHKTRKASNGYGLWYIGHCKCNYHSPWEALTKRGVGIGQPGDSMHL